MKRTNLISWLCAALAGTLLFSCTPKEIEAPVYFHKAYPEHVRVDIEQPLDAGTKTLLDPSTYRVQWSDGDEFSMADMSTHYARYRYSAEYDISDYVELIDVLSPEDIDHAVALYPFNSTVKYYADGSVDAILPREQTYVPNSFDPNAALMMAAVPENSRLIFRNACGILVIKLYGEDVNVQKVQLIALETSARISGKFNISMEIGGVPQMEFLTAGANFIDMVCTEPVSLNASEEDYTEFYFMVPPGTYHKIGIVVETPEGGSFEKLTKKDITITRNHITRMAPVEVVPEGGIYVPEYVDLGLSVPWANFNLGASKPEGFGYLYMWGETEPRTTGFAKENWKYYNDGAPTKYCLWPEDGTVDKRLALEPEDDVATVKLGSEWRMPTMDELMELRTNCTFEETTKNGVVGTLVTGPKGNSIFLPSVGFNETIDPGAYSYLRSSDAYISMGPRSWLYSYALGYHGENYYFNAFSAFTGFSVRAVYAPLVPISGVSISQSSFELLVNATKILTATVQPSNATHQHVSWESLNPSVASVDMTGYVKGLSAGVANIRAWSADGKYSATVKVTVKDYQEPVPVDMGVSVKWADINLGAPSGGYYQAGGYYAWGELNPKNDYTWDNYLWGSSSDNITKYYSGDGQTELDVFEDDAARHYLGGVWRIPTEEEWEELLDNCDLESYTVGGSGDISGIKLTSKTTHNSIYLPAAGYRDNGLRQLRTWAAYQSSSRASSDYQFAGPKILKSSPSRTIVALPRNHGYPIRPVLPDKISVTGFYIQSPPHELHVGETQQLCGVVEPENASLPAITWSSSDESVATVDEDGVVMAVSNGTAIITGTTDDGGFSDSFTLTVSYKIPELVDMGLPSGIKWAKYNLGAVSMQDKGAYFAWGETAPKDEYTSITHTYYNGSSLSLFTQEEGFMDPEHDAATVHLGDGWRIPTINDFDELLQNCTFLSGSYGSTPGFWAVNNDDTQKRIFFPKTGRMIGTNLSNTTYSFGWLSDYYSGVVFGLGIVGDEDGISPALYQFSWSIGLPIRPVYDGE